MLGNQPPGLYILALANTGERFGYFTVLSVFLLYLQAKFGFDASVSGQIYASFMAVVYFMPIIGGIVADKWSFSKCVGTGMVVMGIGYLVVAVPTPIYSTSALVVLVCGLLLVSIGTGLFKSNLQVMIGDLYNSPRYSAQRDSGYSIFYMAINLGAMFAPAAATWATNMALSADGFIYVNAMPGLCTEYLAGSESAATAIASLAADSGMSMGAGVGDFASRYLTALSQGYGYSFAVAFASIAASALIYYLGRGTYAHISHTVKHASADSTEASELTPQQTRSRIVSLLMVMAVVIFFWMVFMQSGATLTEFAKCCTTPTPGGWTRVGFNVWVLLAISVGVYAIIGMAHSKRAVYKIVSGAVLLCSVAAVVYLYASTPDPLTDVQPQDYQQFNGFFIIVLTPISLALFGWLASRRSEPSAPRKIGYGMIMAAVSYAVLMIGSFGIKGTQAAVSGNWLIGTYLLLTVSELLLSPMGISFVSKVAPPKYKGIMMGCWFGSTAIGNYLVAIPMILWGKIPVWTVWAILAALCVLSATVIFLIMRRLEEVEV